MPWELTIWSSDGAPLGAVAAVQQQIMSALPDIQFCEVPSGADEIAAARAIGVEFPDIIRKHMEQRPATMQAELVGDGFSIKLYGFESQPIRSLYLDVRGDANPVPALAALCVPNGWVAIDNASGQPLDLVNGYGLGIISQLS
jgi:hypothetical protein